MRSPIAFCISSRRANPSSSRRRIHCHEPRDLHPLDDERASGTSSISSIRCRCKTQTPAQQIDSRPGRSLPLLHLLFTPNETRTTSSSSSSGGGGLLREGSCTAV